MQDGLRVFNTLSRRKERFKPLLGGEVRMFVCGPTVQGAMHLGHARTYVFYDVLARYLKSLGYRVKYVLNITDIDETITEAARLDARSPMSFAEEHARLFMEDMRRLKADSACEIVPVSAYVDTMIDQVSLLLEKGHAYVEGPWVYFDVSSFPRFGRLSHLSPDELSLRPLELSLRKRNLADFALWRPEALVEGKWQSPWGIGAPGWHIQDVAVTSKLLGPQYDIHGGAYELIYPHHEAEIAEAESLTGRSPLVRYWIHTRLLNMKGEKMSKSRGNVLTVGSALEDYTSDQIRVYLLGVHYRKDMDLSGLREGAARHSRMKTLAERARRKCGIAEGGGDGATMDLFRAAMDDDLNTPLALGLLEKRLSSAAAAGNQEKGRRTLATVREASGILGVDLGLEP